MLMSTTPAIVVEDLVKRFGDFTAVDHISFEVSRGEIFGFLGPNGAGKTTTIRVLLGLLRPTSGKAMVLGYDVTREAKTMQSRVGYMSQLFTLYPDLTAAENILFYGRVYGLRPRELAQRKDEVVAMAGLRGRENELTSHLSGGWKQRLALGCAILHRPELVFLDEPTAGVDPVSRRQFWELIYGLAQQGVTVFVTTHYMDEAEHCQRVGFIHNGRLMALGAPSELKSQQMRGQVIEIAGADAEAVVRALRQAQQQGLLALDEVALYGAQVHVVVPDAQEAKPAIASFLSDAGLAVQSLNWIAPSLEDVFISNVRENEDRTVLSSSIQTGGSV
ncbi:MAG: ABC transporter ATP-binding protein [Chloroflexi bacterium]|nr:ABC transporter ATP-binding protein [Chloroflexota bacterium]